MLLNTKKKGLLLDTREFVSNRINELKERVNNLENSPLLVIIKIGNDPASERYVNNKVKRCNEVGIRSEVMQFDSDVNTHEIENAIFHLNRDVDVTAILLQLPIPEHLDEDYLTNLIRDDKDVDGFTIGNTGKLSLGLYGNTPCTPRGIIDLLKEYITIEGKDVLIINRSNIVGKPLAQLFLQENATVTIAHSKTKDLKNKIKSADIVVTGVGIPNFLSAEDFSDNTIIVDVSINFDKSGKMCGDVCKKDYDILVNEKSCIVTPVPNGIGQMTVLELIEQTIEIAERRDN